MIDRSRRAGKSLAAIALTIVSAAASNAVTLPDATARLRIRPTQVRVFAGASYRFRTAGGDDHSPVTWSVVGDGGIDAAGTYAAPVAAGSAAVVARSGRDAASSSIDVVAPPAAAQPLLLVTCFEDGNVRAYDARDLRDVGAFSIPAKAGGISSDTAARRAIIAGGNRVFAVDAASMHVRASAPVPGARFSEVAVLADGFVAATDNEAARRAAGVRIFRIDRDGTPQLAYSIDAGETPEGIAATRRGTEFFVTSVNSSEVRRFAFDPARGARLLALARTGNRPFGVALDEARGLAFVADNDTAVVSGTRSRPGLEVFDARRLHRAHAVLSTGSAQSLPLGLAVDERAARLFVTNEGDASLAVYALPSLRRLATLETRRLPWLPVYDAARQRVVVPEAGSDSFEEFDARTLRPRPAVDACAYPTSAAILPAAVPARR